jgi:predicted permease
MQAGQKVSDFSYPDYRDLRDGTRSLGGLAAYNGTSMGLEDAGGAARAWVSYVSDNFFSVLRVRPAAGRFFDTGVSGADASEVVVLGYDLWQQRFGGAPGAIGSLIRLEGEVFTIIGVAPPGFIGAMAPHPMEAWIPFARGTAVSATLAGWVDLESRRSGWLRLVGRLAPGEDVAAAQADLAAIAARLEAAYPANRDRSVHVSAGAGLTAEERARLSRVPRLLAAAVGLLLLIACGNVASLSLIRAAARRRELATRLALGASRAALVRQVGFEGIVIAAGAGLLGVLVARLLVQSATLVQTVIPMAGVDLRMDLRVLMIAVAASTLTAVIVALVPSIQILGVPAGAVLKDGGGTVRRRSIGQRVLIVGQVAASLVLLSASTIVFSSFQRVLQAHDRLGPRALSDVRIEIDRSAVDAGRQPRLLQSVLERAAADPAVSGAALATTIPPFEYGSRARVFRRGEEPTAAEIAGGAVAAGLLVHAPRVSGDFFAVMRVLLVRGRTFTMRDDTLSEPVAIVSQHLAEALWPARDPIGEYLAWPTAEGAPRAPLRIVGVAADTRDVSLSGDPTPTMYLPYTQDPGLNPLLLLRGRGDTPVPETAARRIVDAADPSLSVLGTRTLSDRLRDKVQPQRMASAWIGVFGAIALLLAGIGLYGVVAQDVLQRTRELAVRSALGATARRIMITVLGDGLKLAAIGAMVGGLGVVAVQRLLRSLFTGVDPADLTSALAAAAVLATAMFAASWLPARHASRSDPLETLRQD